MASLGSLANYPLTRVARYKAPLTWVFIPGYIGVPQIAGTLSREYGLIAPNSMFGTLTQDNVYALGHALPGREDEYCHELLKLLNDDKFVSGNIVLVGLSLGGQVANRVLRHFEETRLDDPHAYPNIINLGQALMSTFGSVNDLRPPFRQLVKAVYALRVPRSWGKAMKVFAPLFTPPKVKKQLLREGREWEYQLRKRSNASSTWIIDSLRAIATSDGLGSPLYCGSRVVTLNMPSDKVVDPDRARLAAYHAYPKCLHFEYEGTDHGSPEADGPQIAAVLSEQIRPHFMGLWGLHD
jgi:pimeloyl-ACP methyl ester carboxylesterase